MMGSNEIRSLNICVISWVMFLVVPCTKGQQNLYQGRNSLDSFILHSALNITGRIRTGIQYEIPLPSNFSGITASFVRIRTSRLWLTGANYSLVSVPPNTLPFPFRRRIRIVYENLGNWSSTYYNVPNYTLVTPVVGFVAYDATNVTENNSGMVEIRPRSNPILINFPNVSLPGEVNATDVQCVQFMANGGVDFSNVTVAYSCIARGHGHFALVIPSLPIPPPPSKKSKQKLWKWWVIGFGVGFGALILLLGLGILVYKCVRKKRIGRMQRETERSEALESVWVGTSRMPQASVIRTQPTLENNYVP